MLLITLQVRAVRGMLLAGEVRQDAESRLRVHPELLGLFVHWFVTNNRISVTHTQRAAQSLPDSRRSNRLPQLSSNTSVRFSSQTDRAPKRSGA